MVSDRFEDRPTCYRIYWKADLAVHPPDGEAPRPEGWKLYLQFRRHSNTRGMTWWCSKFSIHAHSNFRVIESLRRRFRRISLLLFERHQIPFSNTERTRKLEGGRSGPFLDSFPRQHSVTGRPGIGYSRNRKMTLVAVSERGPIDRSFNQLAQSITVQFAP